ncbi:hypothetical protein ACWGLE_06610 [Streptomyces sp. NPDC055897]
MKEVLRLDRGVPCLFTPQAEDFGGGVQVQGVVRAQVRERTKTPTGPVQDVAVVGYTYFAAPAPGAPLWLRIDFTRTIHADTYGGLRIAVVHPDRGEIDAVALSFVENGTFHRRDEATNIRPNTKQYGTFDAYHRPGRPPWDGAVTTGLRDAIKQYAAVWFPGTWTESAPSRAAGRTAIPVPPLQPHTTAPEPVEPSRSPLSPPRWLPSRPSASPAAYTSR